MHFHGFAEILAQILCPLCFKFYGTKGQEK